MAERYRDELRAEIPEIDAVLGTGEVPEIVKAIGGMASGGLAAPLTFFRTSQAPVSCVRVRRPQTRPPAPYAAPSYIYDADTPRLLATPRHYAYLKIAEGCDYKCAFCIIPTLRGALPQPAGRIDRPGSAQPGGARRQGTAADLAGHHLLRHRSAASAARSRACCAS